MFFCLSQAIEDLPSTNVRVLDAKRHVLWTHSSPEHNLQHGNYLKGCWVLGVAAGFGIFGRQKMLCVPKREKKPRLSPRQRNRSAVKIPEEESEEEEEEKPQVSQHKTAKKAAGRPGSEESRARPPFKQQACQSAPREQPAKPAPKGKKCSAKSLGAKLATAGKKK